MESVPRLAFTIEQLAELAGVGRTTLFGEIGAGRLRAKKIGRRTVVLISDAQIWLERLPDWRPRAPPAYPDKH